MAAGTYTTKYQAGGSGDNYIPDGYIRTVEKVWIDSYTFAFTNTNTTIDLAVLPANKKVTSMEIEIENTVSQTSGTISVGFASDASVDTFLPPVTLTHNLTRTSICLPQGIAQANVAAGGNSVANPGKLAGFQLVTGGTQTTISIKLNNWTMTSGTLKSIVRWT